METYIAVRSHGLKTKLLTKKDYIAIVKGERTLTEYEAYTSIEEKDPLLVKIEKVFKVFKERLALLRKLAGKYEDLVCAYPDILEIENLKFKLREISGRKVKPYLYPYSHHLSLDDIQSIVTEGDLWEKLSQTPYGKGVQKPKFITGVVDEKEAFLDSLYFSYARNVFLKAKRKFRNKLVELLDREALVILIYWSTVFKNRTKELISRGILRGLIPVTIEFTEVKTEELIEAIGADLKEAESYLESEEISRLILRLKILNQKYYLKLAREHPTELPYVIYFLNLALNEALNIERILVGAALRIPEEEILSSLII